MANLDFNSTELNPSYANFEHLLNWSMFESDGKVLYGAIIARIIMVSLSDLEAANNMIALIKTKKQLGGLARMCEVALTTRVDLHHLCEQ